MVPEADLIAEFSFPVNRSEAELAQLRAERASGVPPTFVHRPEIADSAIAAAATFFDALDQAAAASESELERIEAVRSTLEDYNIPFAEGELPVLTAEDTRAALAAAVERSYRQDLRRGVATTADLGQVSTREVFLQQEDGDRYAPRDSLTTLPQFFERARSRAPAGISGEGLTLYQNLIIHFADPTIQLNREATESARDDARQSVERVKYTVLAGEYVVEGHVPIGSEALERYRAYEAALTPQGTGRPWEIHLGGLLFNLLLLLIFGVVLGYFRPQIYASARSVTLIWILLMAVVASASLIAQTGAPYQLIPIAFAALVIATLYDGLLALLAVFVLVGLIAARPPLLGMGVLFSMVMGGSAAALSGRVVRRRAHTLVFAAVIAVAYLAAAVTLGLINRLGLSWVAEAALWGAVNGVSCTFLAAGILPLVEGFTNITTDQSLLELADLNRPLLRRLSLEAPGTYAHSINVANLAEAAAREIDANSLLARVGVYYHDIGKVKKPQYFVENQPRGLNPHDKLKPSTSANIVREHVKDGLELAEEARIPEVVTAFIDEHHGTQRIGFFWEKAQALSRAEAPQQGDRDRVAGRFG
jgi:putative nucleotidyltransferase with HDIG domain